MASIHNRNSWHKVSRIHRINNPICADPFGWHKIKGQVVMATEVHHLNEASRCPDKLLDTDNLLSVCSTCHNALHGKQDALNVLLQDGVAPRVLAQGGMGSFNFQEGNDNRPL